MKGDTLIYRFPNEDIQYRFGAFEKIDDFSLKSGFILSDFKMNEKFIFREGESEPQMFYKKESIFCITKEDYVVSAKCFLDNLKKNNLSKAILSRVKEVSTEGATKRMFDQLCDAYPSAFVYLISSSLFGTWIGATPEVLLESFKEKAKTIALAGTLAVNSQEKWSNKEIEEQQFVADFVKDKLQKSSVKEIEISKREELFAGPVKHLVTHFNFDLQKESILPLIYGLHPTPAVSGLPRKESLELIDGVEEHQRKFYAGIVGFLSEDEVKLFVNLRCAEIQENKAFLYVGGGFTKDSDIEKEWNETERKAETLLNVIQKN